MATATGYLALGSRPACTSMHQETLLLPSVNVGSGDLIIQVLTSLHSIRQVAAAGQGRGGRACSLSPSAPCSCPGVKDAWWPPGIA